MSHAQATVFDLSPRQMRSRADSDDRGMKGWNVNSMKLILEQLWQLQELDRKIISLRESTFIIPDLKMKQEELRRVRLQEQEKKLGLDDLRLSKNQTAAALDSSRQRLMKAESAVKAIKSSDVFQATMKEIDQLKRFEESLELKERGIEKDTESLIAKIAELHHKRTVLEEDLEQSSTLKRSTDQDVAAAVKEVEVKKGPIQEQVQPKYLTLFQRIATARGGIAIVRVRGNSCGGCNMVLPAQFVNELPRSKVIEQCPNCKRILFALSGDSPEASLRGSSG
jgi:hypothetical protein